VYLAKLCVKTMLIEKQHLQAQISLLSYPRMRSPQKVAYAKDLRCLCVVQQLQLRFAAKFIPSSQNHSARKIVVEYLQK